MMTVLLNTVHAATLYDFSVVIRPDLWLLNSPSLSLGCRPAVKLSATSALH